MVWKLNNKNHAQTKLLKKYHFRQRSLKVYVSLKFEKTIGKFWQILGYFRSSNPARIYLLKVNNRNTRTRCEICSKLTIKTPERR